MIHYGSKSKPSALALEERLTQLGYSGPDINFGYPGSPDALNEPEALRRASNKRLALEAFREADIPCPEEAVEGVTPFPWVGRPDKHSGGRGFWLCHDMDDVRRALKGTRLKAKATHFMELIDEPREFRVHVVADRVIKLSEKYGGMIKNHRQGAVFAYPEDCSFKRDLRHLAKQAVDLFGLDFGAVDILEKDGSFFVLEVNTAPCLTDDKSDTLSRYASSIIEEWGDDVKPMAIHGGGSPAESNAFYRWISSNPFRYW